MKKLLPLAMLLMTATAANAGGLVTKHASSVQLTVETQATDGDAFSFSATYSQGDAVPSAAVTTGDTPNFSNVTAYTAGTAGSLAGTIDNAHTMSVTAGGAGTVATGQFVTEITVID